MIEQILPPSIVARELFEDVLPIFLPGEEAVVAKAVNKRRREFASVRHCAREAMASLGIAPTPLLPGERGAPSWPSGLVGSMTHCDGYRAAAVGRQDQWASVGIDAETSGPLPEGLLDAIALPDEVDALPRSEELPWDRLLFCTKEAIYKAWFPVTRRWLDFKDARVSLDPSGMFTATTLVPGTVVDGVRLNHLQGRWIYCHELLISAIAVAAPSTR